MEERGPRLPQIGEGGNAGSERVSRAPQATHHILLSRLPTLTAGLRGRSTRENVDDSCGTRRREPRTAFGVLIRVPTAIYEFALVASTR